MTSFTIDDFTYRRIAGADGVHLNVAVGGEGPAVVLLHGFPQTHYMWRHVARLLAQQYTVIVPDLRGYGDSDKPAAQDVNTYSKRTMGNDIITVVRELGFDSFGLVGHDRGALVAVRAGLDHPESIAFLGILDVLPTLDTWSVLQGVNAKVAWHLYLMAQPAGMPEKMIAAVAHEFYSSFLDAWDPLGIRSRLPSGTTTSRHRSRPRTRSWPTTERPRESTSTWTLPTASEASSCPCR
ncbi:alpha/beta fold hydrolase [Luteipulveratus halotolerans]|uniref:alpha/beta fold hydrolase n=1 Tax=Luteipulveratus halotolerans TaxID=1631356 RepID=UPI000A81DDF9